MLGAVPKDVNWISNIVDAVPSMRGTIEEVLEHLWLDETALLPEYLSIHDLRTLESVALLLCHASTRACFTFSDLLISFQNGMLSLFLHD